MRVKAAIGRSLAVACATMAVGALANLTAVLALCPKHAAAVARARDASSVVLDDGFRFALPGESIFTCTTVHTVAGFAIHDDLGCYCAPAGTDPAALGRALGGTCTLDHPTASRLDDAGSCRHAHCVEDDLSRPDWTR